MQVTLEKVFANVKENKFGPKLSVGLKVKESTVTDINGTVHNVEGKYINAWFDKDYTFPHKEGDVIDIMIVERNGYLDFKLPGVGKPPTPDTGALIDRIVKLENAVFGAQEAKKEQESQPEAVDPEDF